MDTLPRNFFFRGDRWRSYWGTLASCCWLSRSFVLKENAAGFFPRRMSPKWSGTQSVDTREIVYSFLLEIIQRLDRNLVNRSENFSIRVTRIIIDAALYLFEPDDFTSKCVHTHTHTHIHKPCLFYFESRTCDVDVTFQAPWFCTSCDADQDKLFFDSLAIPTQIMFTCENSFGLNLNL